MSLTTARIVEMIEMGSYPTWEWEAAIENAKNDSAADAADAARFLEQLEPGRTWSAAEYHGLMYHHFTGRWVSEQHIAEIRYEEKYEDLKEKYTNSGNSYELNRLEHRRVTEQYMDKVAWLRGQAGTHVFHAADGTVLTFNGIFGGLITEEEPV